MFLFNRILSISFLVIAFSTLTQAKINVQNDAQKIKGVIELGSEGFNSFIIKMDKEKNWELVKSQFGKSYTLDGIATTYIISEGLRNYMNELEQDGVSNDNIHFVVSSGAYKQEVTGPIIANLKKMGFTVNVVSSEMEGQLAFRSVVPDSRKGECLVIDIGSSNTKISWMENNRIVSVSTFGSKYFKENISDEQVTTNLLNEIGPKLPKDRMSKVYLIGGMPYKFAKQTRVGNERYTTLAPLNSYTIKDEKERCGKMILEKLQSAGQIKEFVFDWDSNFSIGFLLEQPF